MVITGDGELLMNLGSLAAIATVAPPNLSIICLDNGCHGETGGQPGHTSHRTNLEMMAQAAGFPATMTIETEEALPAGRAFLTSAAGPRFIQVRVSNGPPTAYKRNLDPAECRSRFRSAYLSKAVPQPGPA